MSNHNLLKVVVESRRKSFFSPNVLETARQFYTMKYLVVGLFIAAEVWSIIIMLVSVAVDSCAGEVTENHILTHRQQVKAERECGDLVWAFETPKSNACDQSISSNKSIPTSTRHTSKSL